MANYNGIHCSFLLSYGNNKKEKIMEARKLWDKCRNQSISKEEKEKNYDIMIYTADIDHNKNYLDNKLVSMRNKLNSFNEISVQSIRQVMGEIMVMSLNRHRRIIATKACIPNELFQKNFESYLEHIGNMKVRDLVEVELANDFFSSNEFSMMVKNAVNYASGLHQRYAQTKENIDNYFEDSIDDLEVHGIEYDPLDARLDDLLMLC